MGGCGIELVCDGWESGRATTDWFVVVFKVVV